MATHDPSMPSVPGFIPTVRQPTQSSAVSDCKVSQTSSRPKRRNRLITSCLECRRRKLKCDKCHPCSNCEKFSRDCIFLAAAPNSTSQHRLAAIKDQVASLEKLLERDARSGSRTHDVTGALADFNLKVEDAESDEGDDLEPTPFAIRHATYDDHDTADELMDLGFQFGKLRLSDRIGGFFRPTMEEELGYVLDNAPGRARSIYQSRPSGPPPLSAQLSFDSMSADELPDYLLPDKNFCCPSSSFALGTYGMQGPLLECLPIRIVSDKLVERYFVAVHPVVAVLHRPTFENLYSAFWQEIDLGFDPPNSTQAKVLAVLFAATLSLGEEQCIAESGLEKLGLLSTLKLGTECALVRAHFTRTTRIETIQALVIYLAPQCRAVVSRAHTSMLAMTVRLGKLFVVSSSLTSSTITLKPVVAVIMLISFLAECMGLQKDPSFYNFSPIECQTRRCLWFTLCILDTRTDYAHGPRPLIRLDEYDVKYPLNLDDAVISDDHPQQQPPNNQWSEKLLIVMRAEGDEKARWLAFERMRVEKKQTKVGSVLKELEAFRRHFEAKYYPYLDETQPLQRLARLVGMIMTSRLFVGLLHRYLTTPKGLTTRLRHMLIGSCLVLVESGQALESEPALEPWAWYAGNWQQYHSSFLLLFDAWFYPTSMEASRIWNALDWAFDCDRSVSRMEKAREIMQTLKERSGVYKSFRKFKLPTSVGKEVNRFVAGRLDKAEVRQEPIDITNGLVMEESGSEKSGMGLGSGLQTMSRQSTNLQVNLLNLDPRHFNQAPSTSSFTSPSDSSHPSQYSTGSFGQSNSQPISRTSPPALTQNYPVLSTPQPDPRDSMMTMLLNMPPGDQAVHDELMNDFDWNEWDT